MSDPFFVPHITIDGIVTLLSISGGLAVYLVQRQRHADQSADKLDALVSKVTDHGIKLDRLVAVAEIQARHDERLMELARRVNVMDQRWEEMRHGKGLVTE